MAIFSIFGLGLRGTNKASESKKAKIQSIPFRGKGKLVIEFDGPKYKIDVLYLIEGWGYKSVNDLVEESDEGVAITILKDAKLTPSKDENSMVDYYPHPYADEERNNGKLVFECNVEIYYNSFNNEYNVFIY